MPAALYLLAINLVAFAAFAADKARARRGDRRIRERTLIVLAALGGSPGAIAGQQLLRHKTRKEPFRTVLWLIAGTQATGLAVALYLAR
ncbi:DUF1294 domain-containing protein [Phenylobacterium hankyongense]|uniref:DUF1294 domain-containing protein n=1 Tax=Phenylobacterium hankyongense TaxID=1813876 RepID=A0A328AYN5_9CAUL|nr:DUF1294 domain-containing protein [Phenylobacterium hankyongense]RAK58704.1 DUF1294 domain-containing protein [Phenylobacterium hankyongense]